MRGSRGSSNTHTCATPSCSRSPSTFLVTTNQRTRASFALRPPNLPHTSLIHHLCDFASLPFDWFVVSRCAVVVGAFRADVALAAISAVSLSCSPHGRSCTRFSCFRGQLPHYLPGSVSNDLVHAQVVVCASCLGGATTSRPRIHLTTTVRAQIERPHSCTRCNLFYTCCSSCLEGFV